MDSSATPRLYLKALALSLLNPKYEGRLRSAMRVWAMCHMVDAPRNISATEYVGGMLRIFVDSPVTLSLDGERICVLGRAFAIPMQLLRRRELKVLYNALWTGGVPGEEVMDEGAEPSVRLSSVGSLRIERTPFEHVTTVAHDFGMDCLPMSTRWELWRLAARELSEAFARYAEHAEMSNHIVNRVRWTARCAIRCAEERESGWRRGGG